MDPATLQFPDPDGSPPLEELLDNASWLRGVAQQMLGDGRDSMVVEDAVQETWLAALKGGPRQRSSAKAWMSTVVRNFGRQRYRGEARRRAREEEAGREEALPSPSEVQERLELTQQLARFVKELPEPYRRTLVLRFYEERSPAWIAEAEGVPVRTIETRLRRGVQKMRDAFEREHVDSREHWLGSLVLLAYGDRNLTPEPLMPIFSGKALPAVFLLAIALSGAALLWRLGSDGDRLTRTELAPPLETVSAAEEGLASSLSPLADAGRTMAGDATAQAIGETRWHGKVVDAATGEALGGVGVGLYTRDVDDFIGMRSGPLGNVCTEWDRSLGPTRAHVEATERTRSAKIMVTPPAEGETRVQALFVQRRGGELQGVCTDAFGAPVPRARVYAWRAPLSGALLLKEANRKVLCDEEGRFEVRDLAGERGGPSRVVLLALTEDLVTMAPTELTVRAGGAQPQLKLEMVPGWRIQGRIVRGLNGREPAAEARLEFALPPPSGLPSRPGPALHQGFRAALFLEACSGEEGRFDCLLPPVPGRLSVATPGFVRQNLELLGPGDHFIRLLPGAEIRGSVSDAAGLPLEGTQVRLLEENRVLAAYSDEFGIFRFSGIAPGSQVALVAGIAQKHSVAPAVAEIGSLPELWEPRLVLEPGLCLEGRVVGRGGEPLTEVTVTLHGAVPFEGVLGQYSSFGTLGKQCVFDKYHARTNRVGRYSICGLAPGSYELVARRFRKGRIIARRSCVAGEPQSPLRLGEGLEDSVTFRGRALYADGSPVKQWRIEVYFGEDSDGNPDGLLVFQFDDPEGAYELPGLTPGVMRVEAIAELPRNARLVGSLLENPGPFEAGVHRLHWETED